MSAGFEPGVASEPISTWRASLHLIRLRVRRLRNLTGVALRFGRTKRRPGTSDSTSRVATGRVATGRKGGVGGKLLVLLFVPLFVIWGAFVGFQIAWGGSKVLGVDALGPFLALQVLIFCAGVLAMELGFKNKDLARGEWDLEWLLTLPVSLSGLLIMKWIEYTVLNGYVWVFLMPLLAAYGFMVGAGPMSLLLAPVFTLLLAILIGGLRVLLETLLRRFVKPAWIRNLQAVATVTGMIPLVLFLGLTAASARPDHFLWTWFSWVGEWPIWLPTGWPLLTLEAIGRNEPDWYWSGLTLLAVVVGGGVICGRALKAWLRGGLVVSSGTLQGGRSRATAAVGPGGVLPRRGAGQAVGSSALAGIGILGKELRLLLRDRSILVGTLVFPAVIISLQAFANPALIDKGFQDPRHASTIAFCVGAYVLMFTAIRVMSSEGQSLWLLYCMPVRLDHVFQRKSLLWASIASIYTVLVLLYAFTELPLGFELIELSLYAVAGLFVVALLASAIGIFGYDPLSPNPQQQVRFGHVYLCMLLVSLYNFGFYAPDAWTRLGLFLTLSLLSLSLWQRLRVQLSYALDPVARPAPRVGLSDGMGTLFVYLVLSGTMGVGLGALGVDPLSRSVVGASVGGAGAVLLLVLLRTLMKTPNLGFQLGLRKPRQVLSTEVERLEELKSGVGPLLGAGIGLAAAAFGIDRFMGGASSGELRSLLEANPSGSYVVLLLLLVVAVPLVHEIIFRGCIYRQLRRERGVLFCVGATSLLYAVVHPPSDAPENLAIGVGTALAAEYGRSIYPAIFVHIVFRATPLVI